MQIYFLRHGIAADRSPDGQDSTRALTGEGIAKMEAEALGMQRIGLVLDLLLTSPLVRAAQTAAIVGRVLGVVPQVESLLAAGMGMQQFMQILDHVRVQRVMVVGHEPDFSYIIGALTGGSQIEMKKGSLALVELIPRYDGDGVLHWLLPPKHLQVLGGR